jgi:hypothetical protein
VRLRETINVNLNLTISLRTKDGWDVWHRNTHNIVTNTGRQFMAEVISPMDGTFARTQDNVVRYIGFGIGGSRQTDPGASAPPLSVDYAGTTTQTDDDVTVSQLERPVMVTSAPLWMREIAVPVSFPSATSARYVADFVGSDINFGAYAAVPLSEIGLYKSSADPALANGGAGAYPGATGHMIAYDTFTPINKTLPWSIRVTWEWRFGA